MDIAISVSKENGEYPMERHVSCVHKFLLCENIGADVSDLKGMALINVWTSPHDSPEFIYEGCSLKMYHLRPSRDHYSGFLQLHTSKLSRVENANKDDSQFVELHKLKRILAIDDVRNINSFLGLPDIDVIGLVFQTSFHHSSSGSCIYITDAESSIMTVKFSANFAVDDFKDVLQVGNVISACNLIPVVSQASIPVVSATILSTFSCSPKSKQLQEAMLTFKKKLQAVHVDDVIEKSRSVLLARKISFPKLPDGYVMNEHDYSINKKVRSGQVYPTYIPLPDENTNAKYSIDH